MAAVWEPSYHAMQWHLPWVTSTRGHAGDKAPRAARTWGPSPILTLRRREGAELRVHLYHERNTFSGFQGRVLPWGLVHIFIERPSWAAWPVELAHALSYES